MRPRLSILILLLLFAIPGKAQWPFKPIHVFDQKAGIHHPVSSNVVQDRHGFLWAGATKGGLYRFDGASAMHFELPGEPEQDVNGLYYDSTSNCLWAGTRGCLMRFDLKIWQFTCFLPTDSFGVDKINFWANKILRQGDSLWVCTTRGLVLFDLKQAVFRASFLDNVPPSLVHENVRLNVFTDIQPDLRDPALLWVGGEFGLALFNKHTGLYRRYFNPHAGGTQALLRVFPWADGRIFVGARDGFYILDPATGSMEKVRLTDGGPSNSAVFSISRHSDNTLIISYSKGIVLFDTQTGVLTKNGFRRDNEPERCAFRYRDPSGCWWGGSPAGLVCMSPETAVGRVYSAPQADKDILPICWGLAELPGSGIISVANSNTRNHLFLNRISDQWQQLHFPEKKLPPDNFRAITHLNGRTFLLGSHSGHLFAGALGDYDLRFFDWQLPKPAVILSLLKDRSGQIWVGTYSFGLFRLRPKNGAWEARHFFREFSPSNDAMGFKKALVEDHAGNIWIGGIGSFSVWLRSRDTILNFTWQEGAPWAVKETNDILCDSKGVVWVIDKDKIVLIEPGDISKGSTRVLLSGKDFFSTDIRKGAKDAAGNIWLWCPRGLEKLDAQTYKSTFYADEYIGTIHGGVNHIRLLADGNLAFACNGRVTVIHPHELDAIKPSWSVPYLRGIKIAGKTWQPSQDPFTLRKINLKPDENVLSFEFSALDFGLPYRNKFYYKMEGVDRDWIPSGDLHQATYVNLPSGVSFFKLRIYNENSGYSPNEYTLEIRIGTPWYRTGWAFAAYSVMFLALVYGFYQLSLNRRLAQAEALRLKEIDAFKNRLFANFTHEFRTPLTLILGLTQKALRGNIPMENSELIVVNRNGERILQLVNQILDLAKLDVGTLKLIEEPSDLIREIRYTAASFESLATLKSNHLIIETNLDSVYSLIDREKLQQVVSNLLSNAVKFSPHGSAITLTANKLTGVKPPVIQITVSDAGPGIAPGHLDKIFDRFYQIEKDENSPGAGTGIGLAIVKEFTELMGGKVFVHSIPGEGATFGIELPLKNAQEPVSPGPNESIPAQTLNPANHQAGVQLQDPTNPIILIVEDSPDVANFVADSLGSKYRFEFAEDGKVGLERALTVVPDLVISDVMMPEMDGYALCRFLKKDKHTDHIPIILLTARADHDSRLAGLHESADIYLTKPFDAEELQLQVQNLLHRQQVWRERFGRFPAMDATDLTTFEKLPDAASPREEFMAKLREILQEKAFDSRYTVPKLCRDIGMSSSQLHRKLTALTGKPAVEIITVMRLEKAKALLANSSKTIAEIAYECGFDDPDYFSRAFSKRFGTTPTKFRISGL